MWRLSRAACVLANGMRCTGTLAVAAVAPHAGMAVPISLAHVLAGSVVIGVGVVSLGDSAECARGAKKPPPTPINDFFKKVTPAQRLTEVEQKLAASGAARKCERETQKQSDIALSIKRDGQDNAFMNNILAGGPAFKKRLSNERTRFFRESDAMLERELPEVLVQVPSEVADAAVLAAQQRQQQRKRKESGDRPIGEQKRAHVKWRHEHPSRVQQALAMVARRGGTIDECGSALKVLKACDVVNADGLFDDLSLGTLRGWFTDLRDNYDGDVAWFIKPVKLSLAAVYFNSDGMKIATRNRPSASIQNSRIFLFKLI